MERAIGIITTNYSSVNPSELTASRPPASVPVLGRFRMVDFMLSSMVNSGIRTVGMILPYKYRSLVDHISRLKDWSLDRKQGGLFFLPGTAFGSTSFEARFLIRDLLDNEVILEKAHEPYVVLAAANIIMNIDLGEVIEAHAASGAEVTMVCTEAKEADKALLTLKIDDGHVRGIKFGVEEHDVAFLDCCVMSVDSLRGFLAAYKAEDYLDLFEAMERDMGRLDVRPYFYEGEALPVFSLETYYKNNMKFLDEGMLQEMFNNDRPIQTKAQDIPPAKYEQGSKVKRSIVSGGCQIAGTVEDSLLSRLVIVEPGAVVRRSIILQSCVIGAGAHIEDAIIDKDNVIPAGTELKGTPEAIFLYGKGSIS